MQTISGKESIKDDDMGGIVGFKKVNDENISFEISRLVYAVDIRKDGTAQVMIEAMVTASQDSEPFNTIELIMPHNSVSLQKVIDINDRTETFLDDDIKENKYRSIFKILDKKRKIVLLSGIKVKIVPIDLRIEERDEYLSIFINFRSPFKKGETKAFRILLSVKNFALITKSKMYGFENFTVDIGFYDRSMIEHGNKSFSTNARFVGCKRIYVWIGFPNVFEILDATPYQIKRKWNEYFLSKGKKDKYIKTLLSYEFDEFHPWNFTQRISLRLRKSFLGIVDLIGILGFILSVIFGFVEILVWRGII